MDYFQGSIAQEDVKFVTDIVTESVVGENFYQLMVFIEASKYVEDATAFEEIEPGLEMAIVTEGNYAAVTKGLLRSWLADFYSAQGSAKVYLVAVVPDMVDVADWTASETTALSDAFNRLKGLAYWKTACITTTVSTVDTLLPAVITDLAALCDSDKGTSGPILVPLMVADPAAITTDPIYAALVTAEADAYAPYHPSVTRNGALLQLSISLSIINGSGTPVGNNFDFVATSAINASGADGQALTPAQQNILKGKNVPYFKYVGEVEGTVAVYGAKSINGRYVAADWLVAYCNYVNKVLTAKYITKMGTYRNDRTYQGILLIMSKTVQRFVDAGRLSDFTVSAPPFDLLPKSIDTIIVPNAWKANFIENVRNVEVYGELKIGG